MLYTAPSLEAAPTVLLDPNKLSADGTVALAGYAISSDGNLMAYGLQASIRGALLTLGILFLRKIALPEPLLARAWIVRLHRRGNGVPYGIALAVAGLVIYPDTIVWQAIVAR